MHSICNNFASMVSEKYGIDFDNLNDSKTVIQKLNECDQLPKHARLIESMKDSAGNFWYTNEAPEELKRLVTRASAGNSFEKKRCMQALSKIKQLLGDSAQTLEELVSAYDKAENGIKVKVTWFLQQALTGKGFAKHNYDEKGFNTPDDSLDEAAELDREVFFHIITPQGVSKIMEVKKLLDDANIGYEILNKDQICGDHIKGIYNK